MKVWIGYDVELLEWGRCDVGGCGLVVLNVFSMCSVVFRLVCDMFLSIWVCSVCRFFFIFVVIVWLVVVSEIVFVWWLCGFLLWCVRLVVYSWLSRCMSDGFLMLMCLVSVFCCMFLLRCLVIRSGVV